MKTEGKIISFLGDSITEGVGVIDIDHNRYDNVLKKVLGLKKVYNYGISGTRLAHQRKPSEKPRYDLCFCGRAYDIFPQSDIIIVYGGVNDYIHGDAPIGKFGDNTPATFCGAVDFLMNLLKTTYINSKIIFLTPARCIRDDFDYRFPSKRAIKGEDKQPLSYYRDVIIETAKKYDILVLDMFTKMPVDVLDIEQRNKYTSDGLHFNDVGHSLIAQLIGDFVKKI